MSLAGSALDLRLKSVLMATDLSPASVKPLHHALAIAGHYEAKLYVAHVVSSGPYLIAGPEALKPGKDPRLFVVKLQNHRAISGGIPSVRNAHVSSRGAAGSTGKVQFHLVFLPAA